MDGTDSSDTAKRPNTNPGQAPTLPLRQKRSKTSKACNACRKQKSRCERLTGDSNGCHRCSVIGIPCIFDSRSRLIGDAYLKVGKPRPILSRNRPRDPGPKALRPLSPDNTGLHVLADTTVMVSREAQLPLVASTSTATPHTSSSRQTPSRITEPPKTSLSPETLSTVESTLFPGPQDSTSESEAAQFRADWRRWGAPLTLLQNLVRRNRTESSGDVPWRQSSHASDVGMLTHAEEIRLMNHFRARYSPLLPTVRLGRKGAPDDVSPFLGTVIYLTASRTLGEISQNSLNALHSLALHHVGQIFLNPATYPLVDSLYALLVLILWPLDAADDVALLVHGAKRLASSGGQVSFIPSDDVSHTNPPSARPNDDDLDRIRLWYAICANETILTLGAGNITTSPAMDGLVHALGSGSELALSKGRTSDALLVLQTNLHRLVVAAMGEQGFCSNRSTSSIPRGHEALQNYMRIVRRSMTSLGKWEIEFHTISAECDSAEAAYYAVLEIEYNYLCLMFATHCLLTLHYACPLISASEEIMCTLWSWSITANKSAHALIRLFNTYSRCDSRYQAHDEPPLPPLAVAPDRVFAMVVIAVMFIFRHQIASYEYGRRRGLNDMQPAGFTKQAENAIRRAIERMGDIGRAKGGSTQEHAAARYADILEALVRIWEEKRAHRVASVVPGISDCASHGSGLPQPKPAESGGISIPQEQLHDGQLDIDLNLLGGDLFSDAAAAFTWDGLGTFDWGSTFQ